MCQADSVFHLPVTLLCCAAGLPHCCDTVAALRGFARCCSRSCCWLQVTRFPRYARPAKLLDTRRGRWVVRQHARKRISHATTLGFCMLCIVREHAVGHAYLACALFRQRVCV